MAEPIASGTLRKTPLPHLLIYLEQKRLSGTLAVWTDQAQEGDTRQDRILMLKGKPVAGRFMQPASNLQEGLLPLFLRLDAPYAFYEGNLLGGTEDRINGRVDPLALIAESLRSTARDELVDEVLGRYEGVKLRLQSDVDFKRYGLQPEENTLIELLKAEPMGVADLTQATPLSEARARRLIYLLTISKAVAPYAGEAQARADSAERREHATGRHAAVQRAQAEHAEQNEQPEAAEQAERREAERAFEPQSATISVPPDQLRSIAGPGGPRPELDDIPSPPDDLPEELRRRWQLMVTKGKLIENQNYYEMLGLERDAKPSDVRTKFFKLAKEWHPDRLPAELAAIKPYAETIFGYMSEAHATLANENTRMKYLQTVREGGGTPATEKLMERILDSAMLYEKVLVMTRKHEYDGALELLRRILAVTKDEAEYHAMHAWLLMKKFPGNEAPLTDMLEVCDVALKLHERHEKANLYKGQVLKRMGKGKEAMRYFKRVVEINPRNVDAAREVRVANMRGPEAGPAPAAGEETGGGLLGKLFKKKK
jgi:tetratricopeptide (TPR) repeat protein